MLAGSVTGGIPGSGTDRSATGPGTCQAAGCAVARRCEAGAVAGRDARADAEPSVSAAPPQPTVKTVAATATVMARRLNWVQHPALGSARRPVLLIADPPRGVIPYPHRG